MPELKNKFLLFFVQAQKGRVTVMMALNRFLKKSVKLFVCFLILVSVLVSSLSASAESIKYEEVPYPNYTYWTGYSNKKAIKTKALFNPLLAEDISVLGDSEKMELQYLCTDNEGNINILDSGNGFVYIFDKEYNYLKTLDGIDYNGKKLGFIGAKGIYYDSENTLYICDTENKRIICKSKDSKVRIIENIKNKVIPSDFVFSPIRVTKDKNGFLYILCEGSYYGLLVLSAEDEFLGFFGANKVTATVLDAVTEWITSIFETKEKHEASVKKLPYQMTDITVSTSGFVCAATTELNGQIRMFAPTGSNILRAKNHFELVDGDNYNFADYPNTFVQATSTWGVSISQKFVGMTSDNDGYIYALDSTQGRIYMYDEYCNLLSVFGGGIGTGEQLGTFFTPSSITASGDDLIVLDFINKNFTVFRINDFGKQMKTAQSLTNKGEYAQSKPYWESILSLDKNCQLAYIGLAKAEYDEGDYKAAMEYSKTGLDRKTYAQSYKYVRNNFITENFKWMILILVIIVAAVIYIKISARKKGWSFKVNPKLKVCLQTTFKPIETFNLVAKNDMGSVPLALVMLALFYVSSVCTKLLGGFSMNLIDITNFNAIYVLLGTVGLMVIYVAINWAVCTLLEGKGNLKKIFCVSCYSLQPLIIYYILFIILSYVIIPTGNSSLSLVETAFTIMFIVWLLLSITVIHDFSFFKAIGVGLIILLGIAIALFIIFIMLTLGQNLIAFILGIIQEAILKG